MLRNTIHHKIVTVFAESINDGTKNLIKKPAALAALDGDVGLLLGRRNKAYLHGLPVDKGTEGIKPGLALGRAVPLRFLDPPQRPTRQVHRVVGLIPSP